MGFFVIPRITPSLSNLRKVSLTIRSSREWKEMTHILPPLFKNVHPASKTLLKFSSSSFTQMRKA